MYVRAKGRNAEIQFRDLEQHNWATLEETTDVIYGLHIKERGRNEETKDLFDFQTSKPRNMNIANVFNKAGFIEAWGRGFSKVMDGFRKVGLPIPTIEERDGGLVINIFRLKEVNRNFGSDCGIQITDRQSDIIKILVNDGGKTAPEIAGLIGVSQRIVETELSFLRKNRFIEKATKDNRSPWIVLKTN